MILRLMTAQPTATSHKSTQDEATTQGEQGNDHQSVAADESGNEAGSSESEKKEQQQQVRSFQHLRKKKNPRTINFEGKT